MRPRPDHSNTQSGGFAGFATVMASQPLHEVGPAVAGAEPAALGFALALAASWRHGAEIVWVGEQSVFAETGAPYTPGLAQFGVDLESLIVVRAEKRDEALWAAEQALGLAGATVLCVLGERSRVLDLKATRRLLLLAERNRSRCLLLRPFADVSAAWTRWRVAPAASVAEARELGAPAYRVELVRSRIGPAGARFTLEWNAHECCFTERVACDFSATSGDGSVDPIWMRA